MSNGTYDPATQEMVYRVTAPMWTAEMPPAQTFVWTQAQWVGVPLNEPNAPAYREGQANDAVDVTVDTNGSLTVFPKSTTASAKKGTTTQAGAFERMGTSGQQVKRGRRSLDALRREAQRRLTQARRADKGKGKGKTTTSSKRRPRPGVKLSHDPNSPIVVWASPPAPICADGVDGRMIIASANVPDGSVVTFFTTLGTVIPQQTPMFGGIATTVLRANPADNPPYGTATVSGSVTIDGTGYSDSTTVDIVAVTSVVWEAIDSPLTANTGNGELSTDVGLQFIRTFYRLMTQWTEVK